MRILLCAVFALFVAASAEAAGGSTLFRLFLTDGTSVVVYGEYTRLGRQVVFSMPIGGPTDQPRLYVVTLPVSRIDWTRTEQYSQTVRASWYADARGQADFEQMSAEVARVLNEVALMKDRRQALAMAESTRRALAEWPKTHFGFRQTEVQEIVALLDESISDLRVALGMSSFDLALVATPVADVRLEPLLDPPDAREQVAQVFRVADLTERAAERVALLQAALTLLAEAAPTLPPAEVKRWRSDAETRLRREATIDAAYASLSRRVMAAVQKAATEARVAEVERALNSLPEADRRLGQGRPEAIEALRASVQASLEAARQLRLRRDLYSDYQRTVGGQIRQLVKLRASLEAIRRLEGPAPKTLRAMRSSLSGGADKLQRIGSGVPDDLRGPHDLLVSAWRFAEKAVNTRADAASSGRMATAWEASSAAAGALMLLGRAQQDINRLLEPPRLQ